MGNLKLTSTSFEDGGEIPRIFGYKNGNKHPTLFVSDMPEGTEYLALIMDDPDAMGAVGKVWVHWVVWNIWPVSNTGVVDYNQASEGMTDFGEVGYGGPAPPDKRHTYVFKLRANSRVVIASCFFFCVLESFLSSFSTTDGTTNSI